MFETVKNGKVTPHDSIDGGELRCDGNLAMSSAICDLEMRQDTHLKIETGSFGAGGSV